MKLNYKKLGDYIRQVNIRNINGKIELLVGVNLAKKFMPSVANIIGTDLTKYKVIKKGQFGCKLMSVGRDRKLPISLMKKNSEAIISSAYYVFEVKDENELLSEYLMMWLSRSENDRYLWFISGADVRGSISWADFCSIKINIPSIEKQQEIVDEYNTIVDRIKLNEQLNQKLEEMAQAIYRQWFVDFEFPDSKGKPYKSSGGKMVYCEELDIEIPVGWEVVNLENMLIVKYGKDYKHLQEGSIPLYGSGGIMKYVNKALYDSDSILIPRKGSLNNIFYLREPFWSVDTIFYTQIKNNYQIKYIFYFLKSIDFYHLDVGSAVPSMTTKILNNLRIILPKKSILEEFEKKLIPIFDYINFLKKENIQLNNFEQILLSKLATIKE